jgi:Fe-Mn family superoxide dismutase
MITRHKNEITRREALITVGFGSAALLAGCASAARPTPSQSTTSGDETMPLPNALPGNHTVVPLPFAPSALNGLSDRMIASHHENNYSGAVRNLNKVEQELAQITADTPPFVVTALRDRELTFRNSKSLHEAYFANLGGNGKRSGPIEPALAQGYGSSTRWEEHIRATGLGLGGGSGWAILAFELDTGALRTIGSGNHSQTLALSVPLVVMDMYEHSYQMDFGAAVPRYIDAFFANLNWDVVNARLERAQRIHTTMRGGV